MAHSYEIKRIAPPDPNTGLSVHAFTIDGEIKYQGDMGTVYAQALGCCMAKLEMREKQLDHHKIEYT